jgi:predicted anti-sigma-YlaC factor YlaD
MLDFPRRDCDAARELLSARLDGELPELETALLDAHLWHCEDCAGWAKGVDDVTRWLREAPLESPTKRIALPSRRRRRAEPFALVAASAAAIVSALAFGVQSPGGHRQSTLPVHSAGTSLMSEERMFDFVAGLGLAVPSPSLGRLRPI